MASCVDRGWTPARIAESKAIGDDIVVALREFRKDHETYPIDLQRLVPDYLDRLDPPVAGTQRWLYSVQGNGHRFELAFAENEYELPKMYVTSEDFTWKSDQ